MKAVSIIIVNWNTGKLLASCIRSLLALPEQELVRKIVVIDNASSDASLAVAEAAAAGNEKVSFVRSGENLGFARANNVGIKRLGEAGEHVLLLNPDTEVKAGALRALVAVLDENPRAGIVGPKLLNSDGSLQPSVRRFPDFTTLAGLLLKLHRLIPQDPLWRQYLAVEFNYSIQQSTEQVMGACFLIRREALQEIGLLDENFWVWFEEVDFCRRSAAAGWLTFYTPAGEVMHHGGASFDQLVGWRKSLPFIASALHYAKKHFSWLESIGLYILAPFALLLVIPARLAHRSKQQNNKIRL